MQVTRCWQNPGLCPDSYWWCTPSDLLTPCCLLLWVSDRPTRFVLRRVSVGLSPAPSPPQLLWSNAVWWKHLGFQKESRWATSDCHQNRAVELMLQACCFLTPVTVSLSDVLSKGADKRFCCCIQHVQAVHCWKKSYFKPV